MTNELATKQRCVLMRSGVQLWIEEEKAIALSVDIQQGAVKGFVLIDGETINTNDIVGIHTPQVIYELNKSKSGQWKCEHGNWIPRGRKCQCSVKPEYREY